MAGIDFSNADWDKIAALLSGSAAGAATARIGQGGYLNTRDLNKIHLLQVMQEAAQRAATQNLANAKFTTALPGQGANEALRGSLIQNVQDVGANFGANNPLANYMVNFTGGIRPSALGPEARAAGAGLAAHGAQLIANPDSFLQKVPGSGIGGESLMPAPGLSEELNPSVWEKAAADASLALQLLQALRGKGGGSQSGGGGGTGGGGGGTGGGSKGGGDKGGGDDSGDDTLNPPTDPYPDAPDQGPQFPDQEPNLPPWDTSGGIPNTDGGDGGDGGENPLQQFQDEQQQNYGDNFWNEWQDWE